MDASAGGGLERNTLILLKTEKHNLSSRIEAPTKCEIAEKKMQKKNCQPAEQVFCQI